jgi:YVTN family beta-propeller protein
MGPLPSARPVRLDASISVALPVGIAGGAGGIWITVPTGADRIDPATNTVDAKVHFGSGHEEIDAVAVGVSGVWVTDFDTDSIYRIDPSTRTVVATIPVRTAPEGVVATDQGVWVANHHGGSVVRIDPVTNQVVATIPAGHTGSSGPHQIAVGLGSVWVGVPNIESVVRIDAVSNQVLATIHEPYPTLPCGGFAIAPAAVWVSSCFEQATIARIDPARNAVVATIDVGGYTGRPFIVGDGVWFPVVDHPDPSGATVPGTLVHIDPATNRVDRALKVAATFSPAGSWVSGDSVWLVDDSGAGRVLRLPVSAFR